MPAPQCQSRVERGVGNAEFSLNSCLLTLGHHMTAEHGSMCRGRTALIAIDDAVCSAAGLGRRLITGRPVVGRPVACYDEAPLAFGGSDQLHASRASSQNQEHPNDDHFFIVLIWSAFADCRPAVGRTRRFSLHVGGVPGASTDSVSRPAGQAS